MSDWSNTRIKHATVQGYRLHKRLGEEPCDACREASSAYDHERHHGDPDVGDRRRARARAWSRAETQMRRLYHDEYLQLLREETGTRWHRRVKAIERLRTLYPVAWAHAYSEELHKELTQ